MGGRSRLRHRRPHPHRTGLGRFAKSPAGHQETAVGEDFRKEPIAVTVFAIGLALIAAAAIFAAIGIWRSGSMQRWSGIPLALASVTYLPHFYLPHAARIGCGALVTVGACWIAVELLRASAVTRTVEFQSA
jgi:hypothetical protein